MMRSRTFDFASFQLGERRRFGEMFVVRRGISLFVMTLLFFSHVLQAAWSFPLSDPSKSTTASDRVAPHDAVMKTAPRATDAPHAHAGAHAGAHAARGSRRLRS